MKNIKSLIFIFFILFITKSCAVAISSSPFLKIPQFNWILTNSVNSEGVIIKTYLDNKNLKTIGNYKIYWEKYEKSTGEKILAKNAVDCKRGIQTFMGGISYNVNGYVLENVEAFTEQNFKAAPEWEKIDFFNNKTIQKVCGKNVNDGK